MVPQWIIEKKRDGREIADKELKEFIDGFVNNSIPDYQMAAFAMAVFFKGMSFDEVTAMTDAMMRSGDVLDWSGLSRPTVDKHSTGGIGDKISIPLAPLVAASGAAVPMISGRGLGITGGTLDKLESIPGYNTQLGTDEFRNVLEKIGCSIIGQTSRLAPADKKLYALRDVTGTVQSIPLIASSIMSKKLAEGAKGLVLDVKCGVGAFMKEEVDAKKLAETMIQIGRNMGRSMSALLTDMNQPLGRTVGHTLEIKESIDVLAGKGPKDVTDLTVELGAEMLILADICKNIEEGREAMRSNIATGAGLETFAKMIEAHGGNPGVVEDFSIVTPAPHCIDVTSDENGIISNVDAESIGRITLLLGGGRKLSSDSVDHSVGIDRLVKVGEKVDKGDLVMRLHARNKAEAESVLQLAKNAVVVSDNAPAEKPLFIARLGGKN
ncbi:MAG: thymidine phosphorylase [Lentisphaerae bacterium]|jgi:pyrimidine-nucleoside phosphorylase|nr:thymidine phosphorylase [Lentisphaerota bacterium]